MVDIVSTAWPAHFCITVRPNCSFLSGSHLYFLAWLLPVCSLLAIGFVLVGAWPVVPFMLFAFIALGYAFCLVQRHAGDYERITIDDDKLVLESHELKNDQRYEFNCYWARVVLREEGRFHHCYLALRSHGREVPFGRLLSDEERASVGQQLSLRLASIRN